MGFRPRATERNPPAGLTPLGWLAVALLATSDLARSLSLGAVTALGALTIVLAVVSFALLAATFGSFGQGLVPWPFLLFILWVGVRLVVGPLHVSGLQHFAVYLTFVFVMAWVAARPAALSYERWRTAVVASGFILVSMYGLSVFADGFGTSAVLGARKLALSALVILAIVVASDGSTASRASRRVLVIALVILVLLSLSRTASLVAILLASWAAARRRQSLSPTRLIAVAVAVLMASTVLVTQYAPIADRFSDRGDNAVVAGYQVNTSGRARIWATVEASSRQARIVGQGAGSADILVRRAFGTVSHPHNDYLRLLHDYGVVGLLLWSAGVGSLFLGLTRRLHRLSGTARASQIAGLLALGAVSFLMLTDNAVVYLFVMLPLAVVLGKSMSAAAPHSLEAGPARPIGLARTPAQGP